MAYASNSHKIELIVERGEPTLVRPAEDTNKGLYHLSNLDKIFSMGVPTVYCFQSESKDNGRAVETIKSALSKLLVPYYPCAGRFAMDSEGKLVVDCSGEGAVFVEAQANCSIEEIGDDTVTLGELAPSAEPVPLGELVVVKNMLQEPPLMVQVTKFKNGGFALGMSGNHCILDGRSTIEFVMSWGEIARGLTLKINPFMDRTILKARNPPKVEFPHQEFSEIEDISNTSDLYNKEELLYRSFFFDPEKIQKLKMAVMEDGVVGKCTSVEVLSAFVWRARARALKLRHEQKIKLLFIVDGRSRFEPPLPEKYFGNGIALTCCIASAGELMEKPLSFAVRQVQEAVKMVTECYLRSAIDYMELKGVYFPSLTSSLLITSWTRLPFHLMDFGWGKPLLSGCPFLPIKEEAMLLLHPKGERGPRGIRLLLGLPTSSMKTFQELIYIGPDSALSKLLVPYYPCAGRFALDSGWKLVVDSNGEGAVFVEAEASCSIEEIGDDHTVTLGELVSSGELILGDLQSKNILQEPPLTVQVTKFKNGGFALGMCGNHCILDGGSTIEFVMSWGKIARGLTVKINPFMDRSILKARNPPKVEFPEIDDISNTSGLYNKEELLYRSFFFDPEKIQKLKMAVMEDGVVGKCISVQALSAFVWRARAQASKLRHEQRVKLLFIVDGRSRFEPPLPEKYFGNGIALTCCIASAGELMEKPLSFAVRQVQEAIKMVTDGYLRSATDYMELKSASFPSVTSTLLLTSWTSLLCHSMDFGWGKPLVAGCPFLPLKEEATLLPHPKGERGINLLLGLPTSSMNIFEELIHM